MSADDQLRKALAEAKAENDRLRMMVNTQATVMDQLRTDNNKLNKQIVETIRATGGQ
jgi:hypothetical protein